jgi:hypothetical protein
MNATELSRRLGQQAEAVCRRYLCNGRKDGRYWLVGNADNAPGRSLYVRLVDGEKGPAGKWTDAATGAHGDLLDIIGRSVRAAGMRETLSEARRFLSLPETPVPVPRSRPSGLSGTNSGHRDAALRLWSSSRLIAGTLAQAYLQSRGLEAGAELTALRFHPGCHYRSSRDDAPGTPTRWPALIAAVTDNAGATTGVHRTWLDPSGKDKAPVAQGEQDGSEVRSVELERLLREGLSLIERRNALEFMREAAGDQYERHFRKPWTPRTGSLVHHKTLTAAMIDSRDFLAAKRKAEIEPLLPTGTRVAFTAGPDYTDHKRIWDVLDRVHAKYPDMVLFHGGNPTGGEHIAMLWARNRKVQHVAFRPEWERYRKAAPFRRNDAMLEAMPKAVIACPGNGINANLVDKARTLGLKVWKVGAGGS